MTEHGFTPGPWAVVRDYLVSSNVDADENALDRHTTNGGIYVARAQGPDAAANARLIAASPTLLEAVQNLMGLFDNPVYRQRLKDDALYPEAIQHARAAITLATGKDA